MLTCNLLLGTKVSLVIPLESYWICYVTRNIMAGVTVNKYSPEKITAEQSFTGK